jgi:RNA polymerase sigma-70 factor
MGTSLAPILLQAWGGDVTTAPSELEAALRSVVEGARAAFPGIAVEPESFIAHLARHLEEETGKDPAKAVALVPELHTDELYLCLASAAGDPRAIALLEKSYFAPTAGAVERLRVDTASTDDVLQQIRASMLVSTEAREAEILRFSGRGSLLGWLRVVATRAALRTKRKKHARSVEPDASVLDDVAMHGEDPELEQIRSRYAPQLREALAWSFEQLRADQRVLLRMYVVDGLTLAELGNVHGVDASTISRWLRSVREQIGKSSRRRLTEQLKLRQSECDSLVGVLQSQLHVSIARLLATSEPDDG